MPLKLKEDPNEWRKFALVLSLMGAVAAWWLNRGGVLPAGTTRAVLAAAALALGAGSIRPRLFRPVYRLSLKASYAVGQRVGKVLLGLIFFMVVMPLGLLLRGLGKDLLGLKRDRAAQTYWKRARPPSRFDQQF